MRTRAIQVSVFIPNTIIIRILCSKNNFRIFLARLKAAKQRIVRFADAAPKLHHSLFVSGPGQVDYVSFEIARIPDSLGPRRRPFIVKHGFTHFKSERRGRTLLGPIFQTAVSPISKSAECGHGSGIRKSRHSRLRSLRYIFGTCGSFLLHVGKSAFGFGRQWFLKTPSQRLIERPACFGGLSSLELGHSEIKKRICVQRPLSCSLL